MNRDLIHFLRLGLMRVRHRRSELVTQARDAGSAEQLPEVETLKILEDLILEQVPYENIDHTTR